MSLMKHVRRASMACIAALFALLPQVQSSQAAVIDLGFALDESGSISNSDFNLAQQGLANALGQLPTSGDNQYRVSVVFFSSASRTIVAPTVVDAMSLPTIQNTVGSTVRNFGGTNIDSAVNALTNLFTGLPGGLGDTTLFNVTTDGQSSIPLLMAAAQNASSAGVDGLSFEAVGSGADINGMLSAAFPVAPLHVTDPNTLPDPTATGFVLEVNNFTDYQAAIAAKVGRIVSTSSGGSSSQVPVPATLTLVFAGMGAIAFIRRRRSDA